MGDPDGRETAPTPQQLLALAQRLAAACRERGLRIATAESCTGGLVAHTLTELAGSSEWFVGGIVAYDNDVKERVLGVPPATLATHGAVSAQASVAMADGCRRLLGADVAASVTGVAGPSGGSPAKPVGLTYVAIADARGHEVRRLVWPWDRSGNKRASAAAAMSLLLERLEPG